MALAQVDRDKDRTADDGDAKEDIAAHACEAQEDRSIQAHVFYKILLLRLYHRPQPGQNSLPHRRGCMRLVRMFKLRGVDDGVVGSQEGEGDGDEDCEADGGAKGRPYRVLLELWPRLATAIKIWTVSRGFPYIRAERLLQELEQFV